MNDQEKDIEKLSDFAKKLKEINKDLKPNLGHDDDPPEQPDPEPTDDE